MGVVTIARGGLAEYKAAAGGRELLFFLLLNTVYVRVLHRYCCLLDAW